MSRQRSDRVDILAVRERNLVEGEAAWTLRYLLCRVTTGAAEAFVIRVHARLERDGSEHSAVAGLAAGDAPAAEAFFRRVTEGCVFPAHLQDVVHDAAVDEPVSCRSAVAAPAN